MDIKKCITFNISCINNISQCTNISQNYGNNEQVMHFGVLDFTDFDMLILLSDVFMWVTSQTSCVKSQCSVSVNTSYKFHVPMFHIPNIPVSYVLNYNTK